MKIIHFIDELKLGGAQTHLLTIVTQLSISFPNDEHIVCCLFEDARLSENFKAIGVKIKIFNFRQLFLERKFIKIIRILKMFISEERADVVETHLTWSRLLANTAAFFARVPKRIGFEQGDVYMNSPFFRASNFLTQFFFDKIIVCSNPLKAWVQNTHKILATKLLVFTNCVDLTKFNPEPDKNIKRYLSNNNDFGDLTFCCVGTLGTGVNKRVDIIINAIAESRKAGTNISLVICGDGDQREKLQSLALELEINDKIFFLGLRDDVNKIIANCDVFCHAAPFEPFGIVCIEAMACGLPSIVPDSGGISEIIQDQLDGFLYQSLNIHDLANKMTLIANDQTLRIAMSKLALENVGKYSVKVYCDKLYKLYR